MAPLSSGGLLTPLSLALRSPALGALDSSDASNNNKIIIPSYASFLTGSAAELKITNTFTRYNASGNRSLMPVDHSVIRGPPLICSSAVVRQLQ